MEGPGHIASLLVPKRVGRSTHFNTLPHHNNGCAFDTAIYTPTNEPVIVVQRLKTMTYVWKGFDFHKSLVNNDALRVFKLPFYPNAVKEKTGQIGGLGSTLRWFVVGCYPNYQEDHVELHYKIPENNIFSSSLHTEGCKRLGAIKRDQEYYFAPLGIVSSVSTTGFVVSASKDSVALLGARIAECGFKLLSDNKPPMLQLGIMRFDCADHYWTTEEYGMTRDFHNWDFSWMPDDWSELAFTWARLCSNIPSNVNANDLPMPLRSYFCNKVRKDGKKNVIPYLKNEQVRQLLLSFYIRSVATDLLYDTLTIQVCKIIEFRYALHGYIARRMGKYKQSAAHLGHGAVRRIFKNKPQYKLENLNADNLKRMALISGVYIGSGFKGTRGKRSQPGFETYKPRKRRIRTLNQEGVMRKNRPSEIDEVEWEN